MEKSKKGRKRGITCNDKFDGKGKIKGSVMIATDQ